LEGRRREAEPAEWKAVRRGWVIVLRLRRETVMTVAWIGQRLQMGSRHTVANCLKAR
jgi:hypothetical protein